MQAYGVASLLAADPIDPYSIWREAVSNFTYTMIRLHKRLDDQIRQELKQRVPDSFRLLRLKKLRLRIKDRMHARMGRIQAA